MSMKLFLQWRLTTYQIVTSPPGGSVQDESTLKEKHKSKGQLTP
jgi:hypothetical protein